MQSEDSLQEGRELNGEAEEQPIPKEFMEWVYKEVKRLVANEDHFNFPHEFAETCIYAAYRHLQSLRLPPVGEAGKKSQLDIVWKIIERFQMERMDNSDCYDNETWSDRVLSYNDIEVALYEVLEQIDPKNITTRIANPSMAGEISPVEKAIKDRIAFLIQAEKNAIIDIDGIPVGSHARQVSWNFIHELRHRKYELQDILKIMEAPPTPAPEVKEVKKCSHCGTMNRPDDDGVYRECINCMREFEPVKDTPAGQGDSLEPCVCVDRIGDNAGCTHPHCSRYASPSLAEQPAHVPDTNVGEIPDNVQPLKAVPMGILKAIEEAWTEEGHQGTAPDYYVNGAIFMYRKMTEKGAKSLSFWIVKARDKQIACLISSVESWEGKYHRAENDLQKMIDDLEAKSEEAMQYRKGLEKVRDDPNKHAAIRDFIDTVLGKYPQL